jgi:hypothetical protein
VGMVVDVLNGRRRRVRREVIESKRIAVEMR